MQDVVKMNKRRLNITMIRKYVKKYYKLNRKTKNEYFFKIITHHPGIWGNIKKLASYLLGMNKYTDMIFNLQGN